VVLIRPQFGEDGRVSREAELKVYARKSGKWELVKKLGNWAKS